MFTWKEIIYEHFQPYFFQIPYKYENSIQVIRFEYIQDLNSIQKHWREVAFYAIVMNEFINIQTHLNFNYVVIRKCQK